MVSLICFLQDLFTIDQIVFSSHHDYHLISFKTAIETSGDGVTVSELITSFQVAHVPKFGVRPDIGVIKWRNHYSISSDRNQYCLHKEPIS